MRRAFLERATLDPHQSSKSLVNTISLSGIEPGTAKFHALGTGSSGVQVAREPVQRRRLRVRDVPSADPWRHRKPVGDALEASRQRQRQGRCWRHLLRLRRESVEADFGLGLSFYLTCFPELKRPILPFFVKKGIAFIYFENFPSNPLSKNGTIC